MKRNKLVSNILLIIFGLFMVGFNSKSVYANEIKLLVTPAYYELNVGKGKLLYTTIEPKNDDNQKIVWKSEDTSIATVTSKGKVQAKSPGTTCITASVKDVPNVKASMIIKVKGKENNRELSLNDFYEGDTMIRGTATPGSRVNILIEDSFVTSVLSDKNGDYSYYSGWMLGFTNFSVEDEQTKQKISKKVNSVEGFFGINKLMKIVDTNINESTKQVKCYVGEGFRTFKIKLSIKHPNFSWSEVKDIQDDGYVTFDLPGIYGLSNTGRMDLSAILETGDLRRSTGIFGCYSQYTYGPKNIEIKDVVIEKDKINGVANTGGNITGLSIGGINETYSSTSVGGEPTEEFGKFSISINSYVFNKLMENNRSNIVISGSLNKESFSYLVNEDIDSPPFNVMGYGYGLSNVYGIPNSKVEIKGYGYETIVVDLDYHGNGSINSSGNLEQGQKIEVTNIVNGKRGKTNVLYPVTYGDMQNGELRENIYLVSENRYSL